MVILEQADSVEQIPLEWESSIMQPARLTKDEQVRMAARTTVCFFLSFLLGASLRDDNTDNVGAT